VTKDEQFIVLARQSLPQIYWLAYILSVSHEMIVFVPTFHVYTVLWYGEKIDQVDEQLQ
jgi:hypothetical protein